MAVYNLIDFAGFDNLVMRLSCGRRNAWVVGRLFASVRPLAANWNELILENLRPCDNI